MKLTKEQIDKIKELKNKGITYKKIAEELNVSVQTINYHLNAKTRDYLISKSKEFYKNLPLEKRRELAKKHIPYQRVYQKNKYHTNELFRNKMIEANKISNKKRFSNSKIVKNI